MNRQELAKLLNVSRVTLNNWEKEKPELIRLINQGLAIDEQIEEIEKNLKKLKDIKDKSGNGKLKL
jgi:DNA-binding XRE family transcriptional regulator